MSKVNIVYGPPGTGKTTNLLNIIEKALSNGIKPWDIGYISYTKAAVRVAVSRATAKFNLKQEHFPYFQTLHALCKQQANISSNNIIQSSHKKEFCEIFGLSYTGNAYESDYFGMALGDKLFQLEELSRIKQQDLQRTWMESIDEEVDICELGRFAEAYHRFKSNNLLYDFTDILDSFISLTDIPNLKLLVVDEAQDLSKLQWACINKLIVNSDEVYITGDDDQAIYEWNGADVHTFINLEGRKSTLSQSYRLPQSIYSTGNDILGTITTRVSKLFKPKDSSGNVFRHNNVDDIDMREGSWLLLARNTCYLTLYEEYCRQNGYNYILKNNYSPTNSHKFLAIRIYETLRQKEIELSKKQLGILKKYLDTKYFVQSSGNEEWKPSIQPSIPWYIALTGLHYSDIQYYRKGLSLSEFKLSDEPRIKINTIHGVKGDEATNVVLLLDIAGASYENYQRNPDQEHRVFYVGVTRAKENLYLINPMTSKGYEI